MTVLCWCGDVCNDSVVLVRRETVLCWCGDVCNDSASFKHFLANPRQKVEVFYNVNSIISTIDRYIVCT